MRKRLTRGKSAHAEAACTGRKGSVAHGVGTPSASLGESRSKDGRVKPGGKAPEGGVRWIHSKNLASGRQRQDRAAFSAPDDPVHTSSP